VVTDGADIDETDLQWVGSAGIQAGAQTDSRSDGAKQHLQGTLVHELELHFVVRLAEQR
jgi:hypothetical protein